MARRALTWRRPAPVCACGCGNPLRERLTKEGWLQGYSGKYAPDCPLRPALGARLPNAVAYGNRRNARRKPVGAETIHRHAGTSYRLIKVSDTPTVWVYEHRLVAERKVGRALLSTEHAHHVDGNGLNNDPDNIVVLTANVHSRLHRRISGWARDRDACVACGRDDRPHAGRGLCHNCYNREHRAGQR